MGSLSNVSRKVESFNKLTILSLQIVIKCQHFINIFYFYVYMHEEKLLLFKINTTCNRNPGNRGACFNKILGPNGLIIYMFHS